MDRLYASCGVVAPAIAMKQGDFTGKVTKLACFDTKRCMAKQNYRPHLVHANLCCVAVVDRVSQDIKARAVAQPRVV